MEDKFQAAVLAGLIDGKHHQMESKFSPELLVNDGPESIWDSLKEELLTCQSFEWVVAFWSPSMLTALKVLLADLAVQGVHGRILTGAYLNFNQPAVFRELLKLPQVEVRLSASPAFHSKGYLFTHAGYQTAIVGSANFTRNALLKNTEWALKVASQTQGDLTQRLQKQFQAEWDQAQVLTPDWIDYYAQGYQAPSPQVTNVSPSQLAPNAMQKVALTNLADLRQQGQNKGLVISATGTGKTYLAAFDVQKYRPRRFLFVVHRQQIAQKALESFKKVLGGSQQDYGILSGDRHDYEAKYLFATVQTLSQPEVLASFEPTDFDYMLIDEAHRSAAPSYLRVLNYFQPNFLLGMTATPERSDAQNIFQLYDYNVAYEIRLQDALQAEMLCPFDYVGIPDYEPEGQAITEKTSLKQLQSHQRVDYLVEQLAYYGQSEVLPKGLIFVSRKEEAQKLAQELTQRGLFSQALTNEDSHQTRQDAVAKLEAGQLQYLLTVDIFNEGIDIPAVNQVIFMRNTESSIIFTQQLGRGLRKYPGKQSVLVLDLIGNYQNNYLIALALSGNRSGRNDQVLREMTTLNHLDLTTINLSRVAQERIFASLEKVRLDNLSSIKEAYHNLENKLGQTPKLYDFYQFGDLSPAVFARNNGVGNYIQFRQKMGQKTALTAYQDQVLTFVTKELLEGLRIQELILLSALMDQEEILEDHYLELLDQAGAYYNAELLASVDQILSLDFFAIKAGKQLKSDQYGQVPLIEHQGFTYRLGAKLARALEDTNFKADFEDVLKTGIALGQKMDQQRQFTPMQQYTRKDVCRLLNWPKDVSAPLYGYRVTEEVCPIFVTYDRQNYANQIEANRYLTWFTRSPRHLNSPEVQLLLKGVKEGQPQVRIEVFMKRSDATGKGFYYLGSAQIVADSVQEEKVPTKNGRTKSHVKMLLELHRPLNHHEAKLLTGE
ncbi:MAG: DEAD/DEAH box helicase [Ligilactobacillus sp.]|nr:DEAD/DEAH box helicase [Ligilactobacillus sp.]